MADTAFQGDPRDYVLDLSSAAGAAPGEPEPAARRPFLSILFQCCGVYAPIYKTGDGRAYAGHCPRCARAVRVAIGPGGTTSRTFIAG